MTLTDADLHRYARQLILPTMDEAAQAKIKNANLVLVGAGGIGTAALIYLAAAGVGRLTLIDGDKVEATNLNRQICFTAADIGKPKAEVAATHASRLNPTIKITPLATWLQADNAKDLIATGNITMDTSDSPAARAIINRTCHAQAATLIFASAIRLEGQLASFTSGLDPAQPCLACAFPDLASPESARAAAASQPLARCDEVGILGAITGVLGSLAALEALRHITAPARPFGESLAGRLLLYDGRDQYMRVIRIAKDKGCAVCQ